VYLRKARTENDSPKIANDSPDRRSERIHASQTLWGS
jgi:hypothetical protein